MTVHPQDLRERKDAMNGRTPAGQQKVENVVKFFQDEDKIRAIKALDTRIQVGDPPTSVVIKPMSPRGVAESYSLIRKLLLPIVFIVQKQRKGESVSVGDMLDAFGENIDALPELIFKILERGNPQVTREWCDNHLDFALDLQLILPHFLTMNGLDRLFAPKNDAGAEKNNDPSEPLPQTAESPQPSPSSADGTDGPQSTSGTS